MLPENRSLDAGMQFSIVVAAHGESTHLYRSSCSQLVCDVLIGREAEQKHSCCPIAGTRNGLTFSYSINSSRRPSSRFLNSLFGDDADSAGLWSVFSRLFNKPDGCPDFQTWEGWAENAVLVEIDLSSVVRSEESVTFLRQDLAHASLGK